MKLESYLRFFKTHLKTISFYSLFRPLLWGHLRKAEFGLNNHTWKIIKMSMLYQIETMMLIVDRVLLSFLFHLLNFFSPSSFICLIFFFVSSNYGHHKPRRATSIKAMITVVMKPRTWFASRLCPQGTVLGSQSISPVVINTWEAQ